MAERKVNGKTKEVRKQSEERTKKQPNESVVKELENKYKKLEEDYLALKERYNELESYSKKLKAEFENYKQLVVKEKQQIIKNATEYMIEKLIPIVDNFERALKNVNFDDLESLKSLIKGVEMIYKSLLKLLENEGVKIIESNGKKFDPFEHEAVEKIETDEVDEFTIIEEIEKGYKLHSKVLKPAKVKVAIKSTKRQNTDGENAKN